MLLTYMKQINVKKSVDVFIAGGGPAGVAAAVAAARTGASVFVAESFGAFGGAATHALIPAFMQFTDGVNFLADGIGREVRNAIAGQCPESARRFCPDSIPVETLKLCYDNIMTSAGADSRFFTTVTDVILDGERVTHAICGGKDGLFAVEARVFIDCTGDGDLCAHAGASFLKGDENGKMMAATLCALWSGVDWARVKKPDSRRLEDAFRDGVFTANDRHLPGMWPITGDVCGSNAGHIFDVDGTDMCSLTDAIQAGRKQLLEYRRYYREYLSGYENAELTISATVPGVRETRRISGDYVLNFEDFVNRAVFEDEIGRYAYPVDIHASDDSDEAYKAYADKFHNLRYTSGESYGIPYRCLLVKGLSNVLTAGRCISTDRAMQSSVRVMPGCFITGQAAGTAAALSLSRNAALREVPVRELQSALLRLGAYLPNA